MADITYASVKSDVSQMVSSYRNGFVLANGFVMTVHFQEYGQRILDMEVRDDDVWVCSYPKTGTTWTQEMVWCIANDLDFEAAKQSLTERFPYLEYTTLFNVPKFTREKPDIKMPLYLSDSIEYTNQMKSPRFIKTHLPYELLPKKLKDRSTKAKIVCVARNPKDTCLSYFYHARLLMEFKESFEDFCRLFTSDLLYSPFFDHILGYWNQKDDRHVLFLKYEDMKQDLPSIIRKTAKFLGKDLLDDQVLRLEDHLSFESMKKNRAVNYEPLVEFNKAHNLCDEDAGTFMRSGTVGSGKQEMSPEYLKIFDEWEEKCLEKTGLKFL